MPRLYWYNFTCQSCFRGFRKKAEVMGKIPPWLKRCPTCGKFGKLYSITEGNDPEGK